MKPFGNGFSLKKKVSYKSQVSSEKISTPNIKLINQILDTINTSLLVLIFIFFFLSFNSQREWSSIYKNLTNKRIMNSNLIDYISKIEEFYISELDSINTYRKTKPEDLIYIDKVTEKKESFFNKNFRSFYKGLTDSKYQRGY